MSDEIGEITTVIRALIYLSADNDMWRLNKNVFLRMNEVARIRYWRLCKKQAELGAPAMVVLVSKVIQLRMQ